MSQDNTIYEQYKKDNEEYLRLFRMDLESAKLSAQNKFMLI